MLESHDTDAPALDLTTADDGDAGEAAETPDSAAERGAPADSDDAPDGPPRDDRGRFAPKAGSTPATAESPDGEDGDPATDDPDAPAADPDDPEAAPTAPEPAPEAAPAAADVPFTFPHRGQAHAIDGAVVKPDGSVVIPAAARQRVDLLLTRGREHEVALPQFRQELAHWKAQAEARDAGLDAFTKLLDIPDDEQFLAAALEFRTSLPQLRLQQMQEELERLRNGGRTTAQAEQANGVTPDAIRQEIVHVAGQKLLAARAELPEFQGFTDAEITDLHGKLGARAGLYVRAATAEDAARWGVTEGEPVFDDEAFVAEAKLLAGPVIQQKRAAAAKAKQAEALKAAAKRNAAVLTKPKLEPTPTPASASGDGEVPTFKNQKEYEAWLARYGVG